ncbi:MAG: hypothetical protein H8E66_18115 [Planctomycetes bacterium]|nr:hypothetical protein [Planctomycetota bacterium]
MTKLRWFVGLLGVVAVVTICVNLVTEQRNSAFAAEEPADLLARIETLEARVAMLEGQLTRTTRALPRPTSPSPTEPKYWSKGEFNGAPVYIVPLGVVEPKN